MSEVLGLVLDVDDTLYMERDYVRSGFTAVDAWLSRECGIRGVGDAAWRLFLAGVRRTTLGDALAKAEADPVLLPTCIDVYRRHKPEIELLPDARSLIDRAFGMVPIAVVTDGPAPSQWAKCEALGLLDVAEPIVVTADLGRSKPDPGVFEAATAAWDIPAAGLVYVADNPAKDFRGPQSLGWQTLRVRRPGSLHFGAETPAAVPEVSDLSSVMVRGGAL